MRAKTSELTGAALDWAVAKCEGYGWARNASARSGDSFAKYYNSKHKDDWPIEAVCFVSPDRLKELHPIKKNWDGWLQPVGDEPLAPAAFYGVPKFSSDWNKGGPIIEREYMRISPEAPYWEAVAYEEDGEGVFTGVGETYLVAAMRCYVASKLGDEVDVPDELV